MIIGKKNTSPWSRIFCSLSGCHEWETVSLADCVLTVRTTNGAGKVINERDTGGVKKIQRCARCDKVRGLLVTSDGQQEVDAEFLVARSDGKLHL